MSCYLRPHRAQVTTCRIQSQEVRYTMTLVVANTRPQAVAVSCLGLLALFEALLSESEEGPVGTPKTDCDSRRRLQESVDAPCAGPC